LLCPANCEISRWPSDSGSIAGCSQLDFADWVLTGVQHAANDDFFAGNAIKDNVMPDQEVPAAGKWSSREGPSSG
jgi:hypothetical protein